MATSTRARAATHQLLLEEARWRDAAERLAFDPPDPRTARRRLLEFVRWSHPNYLTGHFARELCGHLEWFSREVAAQRSPRLLIAAPPRHGKSQVVSRAFPVWHLGNNPSHEIVVASYGQELANDMSRDARAIRDLVLEAPGLAWPHLAAGDKDGIEYWRTLQGGSYKAVGAGGPLTGRGCHICILDDLIKNSEEADSETIRKSRWDWYRTTAYTRLHPGGGVLMMATRWNAGDPSGLALDQLAAGEEAWRVVSYPAVAEEDESHRRAGEALHPERYNLDALNQIRTVLGPRGWAALYQQRPSPEAGGTFQRAWLAHRFTHEAHLPPEPYTEIVVSVDATFKASTSSDYVAMQAWGRKGWATYDWLDERRARLSYVQTRQALRDFVHIWRPSAVLVEEKANGAALLDDLRHEIPGLIGFIPDKHGNKVARASLATRMWEAGQVRLPAHAHWAAEAIEELAVFPAGKYDDRVDAMSQVFLWWAERRGGAANTAAKVANMEGAFGRLLGQRR